MDVVIYHNPRCSKSRQTLELLKEKGIEPETVEYLKQPPDADTLRMILSLLGRRPAELLRKGEDAFRTLQLADRLDDDEAIIAAMLAHPRLIERPIVVVDGQRAAIGRPPESVLALFE